MPHIEHPEPGEDLADIADALRTRHGCHTAIVYGSFATGDAHSGSDYDVAGFADSSAVHRIAGRWRGSYLDLFVYPDSRLNSPDSELLHLRGGVILFEKDNAGKRLLGKLEEIFARGPGHLPPDELRARRRWAWKMLDRAAREDPEGNFRRAWLLTALLEDYFHLRQMWYLGPKKSLAYLGSNAPEVYRAFEEALQPGSGLGVIAQVVGAVAGRRDEESVNEELMTPRPGGNQET